MNLVHEFKHFSFLFFFSSNGSCAMEMHVVYFRFYHRKKITEEKKRSLCRSAFMIWLHIKWKPFSYRDIDFHRIQCNLFYFSCTLSWLCFAFIFQPTDTFHSLIMLSIHLYGFFVQIPHWTLCHSPIRSCRVLHDRCLYKSYLAFITLSFFVTNWMQYHDITNNEVFLYSQ